MDNEAWKIAIMGVLVKELHPRNSWPVETMDGKRFSDRLEALSNDILKFFIDGDGFDPEWMHVGAETTLAYVAEVLAPFPAFRGVFEAASEFDQTKSLSDQPGPLIGLAKTQYSKAVDRDEGLAVDAAKRGDFRGLENIIAERGVLRTSAARKLILDKLQGKKAKRGETKSTVNRDALTAVLQVMKARACDFQEAQALVLSEDVSIDEGNFKKQVARALNESPRLKWMLGKSKKPTEGQE
jgi:hypothetical protein